MEHEKEMHQQEKDMLDEGHFEVPGELQEELNRLKKREKALTWVIAGTLALTVAFGINWFRAQNEGYSQYSDTQYSAGYVSNTGTSGAGGGCCSAGGGGAATDLTTVQAEGLAFYQEKYNSATDNVSAEAKDYGCHVQCDIVKDGKVIKSFSYQNGQFNEI